MDSKQQNAKAEEETDTLPPMLSQQPQQQQQQPAARAPSMAAAVAAVGRRGTVTQPGGGGGGGLGGGGPRRSIAAGMLNRATLMSLGNLARRSKAQGDVRLENTYRMAPKDEERLRCWKLRPLVAEALSEILSGYAYSPATAGRKACDAALAIRNRARDAGYERYKFVVFVAVMENRPDTAAVSLASRALWAPGPECADGFTEAACASASARAHATLHAVYFE